MMRRWARWVRASLRRGLLALPLVIAITLLLHQQLLTRPQPRARPAVISPFPTDDLAARNLQEVEKVDSNRIDLPQSNSIFGNNDVSDKISKRPWYMKGGKETPSFSTPLNRPPLFPDEDPTDDRITNQLMYLPEPENDSPRKVKKILLANGIGAWGAQSGRAEFAKNKCPVSACELTSDMKEAATADAVLFKDHHIALNAKRPANQIWILYYLECPYHTPSLRNADAFNWTATYRRDSDIVAPYERWVYHDPKVTQFDRLEKNYAANKTKKVAWFVSNCHARNRRLQYARELSQHISVDIFGACGSQQCPRHDPDCLEMLDRDYKFYLAFENSNCRDYITEKFFVNGLGHDVLPIVMGARPSEYEAVSPRNSYIHVEEFQSPSELAVYLHLLDRNPHLYNAYFKWKGTGEFINTFFFCRVCALLHAASNQDARPRQYRDVHAWWRNNTCTRDEWREHAADSSAPVSVTHATPAAAAEVGR